MTFKIITLILMSSVKFALAFPIAMQYQLGFLKTFFYTSTGGVLGVLFFAFLTQPVIKLFNLMIGFAKTEKTANHITPVLKKKTKTFSQRKKLVKIKLNYGLLGIVVLTPTLLSIPVGTFLAVRFYSKNKSVFIYLILSVIIWSLLLSFLASQFNFKFSDAIDLLK